ncbi:MAG: hypothetical protein ACKO4T_02555 [Planctomycetaceae bacterium]
MVLRILAIVMMLAGIFMGGCALTVFAEGIAGNPFVAPALVCLVCGLVLIVLGSWVFRRARRDCARPSAAEAASSRESP